MSTEDKDIGGTFSSPEKEMPFEEDQEFKNEDGFTTDEAAKVRAKAGVLLVDGRMASSPISFKGIEVKTLVNLFRPAKPSIDRLSPEENLPLSFLASNSLRAIYDQCMLFGKRLDLFMTSTAKAVNIGELSGDHIASELDEFEKIMKGVAFDLQEMSYFAARLHFAAQDIAVIILLIEAMNELLNHCFNYKHTASYPMFFINSVNRVVKQSLASLKEAGFLN